ncbi:MAG: carbohydrate binding domain-containing protein [Kiritimatiellae bacterium]|jgi:hypothetical protein|nr:carbohydrate binding domain-containing protein [Kiritimatiellia bacterium]
MRDYRQLYLSVTLLAVTCVLSGFSRAADDAAPLFPFVISHEAPDNVTSMAHLLDAPAGKHGFVRVEKGRFATDTGPIKFNATNLTGPANFPSHKDADILAARLARFGINCVRLHYFDASYGNFKEEHQTGIFGKGDSVPRAFSADPSVTISFNKEAIDCQDYLIAALKKRGIYVNMNLHVARFPKGYSFFSPRMIASEKEYARKLLTRVNPYTGLAYTNDPCMAMIEINNENALFRNYMGGRIDHLSESYASEFQQQWNDWLKKKYGMTEAMRKAWNWKATPLCDEQITEGSFEQAVKTDGKKWTLRLDSAKAEAASANGVMKITVAKEGDEYFPKLFRNGVKVKKGEAYTISFKVRRIQGEGSVELGTAVAETSGGWRSMGFLRRIKVGPKWTTVKASFAAAVDSDKAQFQLTRFKKGVYEIDDLSIQSGAASDFDSKQSIEEGSIAILKTKAYAPLSVKNDFYKFLEDTESAYWNGIADYVHDELKAKVPISGTQLGYSPSYVQAELDYVDIHSYWCHPSPVSSKWRIGNTSMVNSMSGIQHLAELRVLNKPYTVSEYNHPCPNQYGAEGQPMLRAYGALQGWDGVFEYTWHHRRDYTPGWNSYFFSISERTDVLAHMPACAAIFLRGDVHEAKTTIAAAVDYDSCFERLVASKSVNTSIGNAGFKRALSMIHKTGVDLSGKVGTDPASVDQDVVYDKVLSSDTGELCWNREEAGAGYFTVNTADTKLFTGFPKGRTVTMGDVTLKIGKTRLNWATVSLVSRHATGFGAGKSANILLAATGEASNSGMELENTSATRVAAVNSEWGKAPVVVEGIAATLMLPSKAERTSCYALDGNGDRTKKVHVVKSATGGSQIVIGPEYRTVWYEIEVK